MKQYKVITVNADFSNFFNEVQIQNQLNNLASQGWEVKACWPWKPNEGGRNQVSIILEK